MKKRLLGVLLSLLLPLQAGAITVDFIDSFDHYATTHITQKYSTVGVSPLITASVGRRSTSALAGNCGSQSSTVKTLPTARSTITASFAFRVDNLTTNNNIFHFQNNTGPVTHVTIAMVATAGTLTATGPGGLLGTTSSAISAATFYHIQVKVVVHDTTGSVEIKFNETTVLNVTGVDTRNGATTNVDRVALNCGNNAGQTFRFDDFIISDDFPGDQHVKYLAANANGNYSQWDRLSGSNNYEMVDEASPDDDTTYVSTAVLNEIDSYGLTDLSTGETILAIQSVLRAKKSDAGTRSISPLWRIGGTDYVGTQVDPSDSSYNYFFQIYNTSPATAAAWTLSEFNAAEFGPKVTQ
jgi:hypothetical protein